MNAMYATPDERAWAGWKGVDLSEPAPEQPIRNYEGTRQVVQQLAVQKAMQSDTVPLYTDDQRSQPHEYWGFGD